MPTGAIAAIVTAKKEGATHQQLDTNCIRFYRFRSGKWETLLFLYFPATLGEWKPAIGGLPKDAQEL